MRRTEEKKGENNPFHKERGLQREGSRKPGRTASSRFSKSTQNKNSRSFEERRRRPKTQAEGDFIPSPEPREDRLEGKNPILEAYRAGRNVDKLWVLEGEHRSKPDASMARILRYAEETGTVVLPSSKATLDRLSLTGAHQGVIAQVAVLPYVEVEEILDRARQKGEDPFLLIADEIQDAYNLGSLFRIAEAAGIHGIILPKRRQVLLDSITAKASAGAVNHVPCARVNNLNQCLELLKKEGLWIAGTTLDGEAVFDNPALVGPLALVIGNEGKGISPLVRKNCDFLLTIPMVGVLNSLNAAVAAGIVVFEAKRLREQKKS